MKSRIWIIFGVFGAGLQVTAMAQKEDVPLMRPDEKRVVDAQSAAFNEVLGRTLSQAAKSTVRVWGKVGRSDKPMILAYGTVIEDGSRVLTKWSEVERAESSLYVQAGGGESFPAKVAGVFTDEDLVLLELSPVGGQNDRIKDVLVPAEFSQSEWAYGRFVTAPQPDGQLGGFGVVSVLERNLRETDRAHLGIMADQSYRGKGVRIASVQPEYGAADAGIQSGDVILKIDGREITGLQELRNALSRKQPGDLVKLQVETAGKERSLDVTLSNRPIFGQFSFERLNQMERMGGEPNRVRGGFSRVVQSDMKIQKNQVGGPVVNLEGEIVGITLARADRTRTYLMSGAAVEAVLNGKSDSVAEAREKIAAQRQQLADSRREMMPKMRMPAKPMDPERMERQLSDLERLLGRVNRELDILEGEESR
jgi:hypothetical protein